MITTAVAVMVSPTKVAATHPSPNNMANPKLTPTMSSPITVGSPSGRSVTATNQIPARRMSRSKATSCMTNTNRQNALLLKENNSINDQ